MDNQVDRHKWLSVAIAAMIMVVATVLALLNFWADDDINYQFVIGSSCVRLDSVGDLVRSQICHYQTWNGRVVAHVIVQMFCGLFGQTAFAICHGIVCVLFAIVTLKVAGCSSLDAKSLLIFFVLVMLSFLVPYGPAFLVGYYWMPALVLSWLVVLSKADKLTPVKAVVLSLFSICAGNSQEAFSVGIIAALTVMVAFNFKKVKPAQWLMMVCFLIGFVTNAVSPGVLFRYKSATAMVSVHSTMLKMLYYLRVMYVMILFAAYLIITKRITVKEFVRDNLFWLVVVLSTMAFTMIIGCKSSRQLLAIELASIIIVLRLQRRSQLHWAVIALSALLIVPHIYYHTKLMLHRADTMRNIERLYCQSPDGTIYYDFDGEDVLLYETLSFPFEDYSYCMDYLSAWLECKHGSRGKRLNMLPTVLEHLDSINVKNQVVTYGKHGPWLMIVSKKNPQKFSLLSHTGVEFINYHPCEINYLPKWGYAIKETDTYVASWVTKSNYPYVHYDAIKVVN